VILLIEPETPPVPMLIAFVVDIAVAPVPKFKVWAPVDKPSVIAPVPEAPPILITPLV
jgi:hypothetical protein